MNRFKYLFPRSLLLLVPMLAVAATVVTKISDFPNVSAPAPTDLFLLARPGQTNFNIQSQQLFSNSVFGGNTYISNAYITNLTVNNAYISNAYVTNLYTTNVNSDTFVTNLTVNNFYSSNAFITNLYGPFITNQILYSSNSFITNLTVEVVSNIFLFSTNIFVDNITVNSNIVVNSNAYFITTNFVNNQITTNLYSSNIYATNIFVDQFITNYLIFSTNIYVNDTTVSNYFVTNVFNDIVVSNYFNTNNYLYITNAYTTNLYVTNIVNNNDYVSNFFQTNIFLSDPTYVSNYFTTNVFTTSITTNVTIINLAAPLTNATLYGITTFAPTNGQPQGGVIEAQSSNHVTTISLVGDTGTVTATNYVVNGRMTARAIPWAGPTNQIDFSTGALFFYATFTPISLTNIINATASYGNSAILEITNASSTNIGITLPSGWKVGRGDPTSCTNSGIIKIWPYGTDGRKTIATKEFP